MFSVSPVVQPNVPVTTTKGFQSQALPTTNPKIATPIHPSFLPILDADFIEYYNANIGVKVPTHKVDIAEVRRNPAKFAGPWVRKYSFDDFAKTWSIESTDNTTFKAVSYHPDTQEFGEGPHPVHINFHGRWR